MLLLNSKVHFGAGDRVRTGDLLLGKQTLCETRRTHHSLISIAAVACSSPSPYISCLTHGFRGLLERMSPERNG